MQAEVSAKLRSAIRVRAGSSELPVVCLHLHDGHLLLKLSDQLPTLEPRLQCTTCPATVRWVAKCPMHMGTLLMCGEVIPGRGLQHSSRCCTGTPLAWQAAHCFIAICSDLHTKQPTQARFLCHRAAGRPRPPPTT